MFAVFLLLAVLSLGGHVNNAYCAGKQNSVPILFTGTTKQIVVEAGLSCSMTPPSPDAPHGALVLERTQHTQQLIDVLDREKINQNFFEFQWPVLAQLLSLAYQMDRYQLFRLQVSLDPMVFPDTTILRLNGTRSSDTQEWIVRLPGLNMEIPVLGVYERMFALMDPVFLLLVNIAWHDTEFVDPDQTTQSYDINLPWYVRNPPYPVIPTCPTNKGSFPFTNDEVKAAINQHFLFHYYQEQWLRMYYWEHIRTNISFPHQHYHHTTYTNVYSVPLPVQPPTSYTVDEGDNDDRTCLISYAELLSIPNRQSCILFHDANSYYISSMEQLQRERPSPPASPDTTAQSGHPLQQVRKALPRPTPPAEGISSSSDIANTHISPQLQAKAGEPPTIVHMSSPPSSAHEQEQVSSSISNTATELEPREHIPEKTPPVPTLQTPEPMSLELPQSPGKSSIFPSAPEHKAPEKLGDASMAPLPPVSSVSNPETKTEEQPVVSKTPSPKSIASVKTEQSEGETPSAIELKPELPAATPQNSPPQNSSPQKPSPQPKQTEIQESKHTPENTPSTLSPQKSPVSGSLTEDEPKTERQERHSPATQEPEAHLLSDYHLLHEFKEIMKNQNAEEQSRLFFQLIRKAEPHQTKVMVTNNPDCKDIEPSTDLKEKQEIVDPGIRVSRRLAQLHTPLPSSWRNLCCYAQTKMEKASKIKIRAVPLIDKMRISENIKPFITTVGRKQFLLPNRYIYIGHAPDKAANVKIDEARYIETDSGTGRWEVTLEVLQDVSKGHPLLMNYRRK